MVLLALEDLRNSLRSQGSNLMVRLGNAEYVLQKLVREVVTLLSLLTLFQFQVRALVNFKSSNSNAEDCNR